jgi:hypothetical protein
MMTVRQAYVVMAAIGADLDELRPRIRLDAKVRGVPGRFAEVWSLSIGCLSAEAGSLDSALSLLQAAASDERRSRQASE